MKRSRRILLSFGMGTLGVFALTSTSMAAPGASYSLAELESVKTALDLDESARIPGTAWTVDEQTNTVLVSYDDSVIGSKLTALQSATARFGGAVRFEKLPGRLEAADGRTVGGNAISGGGWNCSLGFNLIKNGVYHFITAGHCANKSATWVDNDGHTVLGTRYSAHYGPLDYGIIRYTNTAIAKYGAADNYNGTYQDITHSRWAQGNEKICRSGHVTAKKCGEIRSLCSTVTYTDGVRLTCLIRATACAAKGDSGGPMYAGTAALGIFSGGVLGCGAAPNGPTYYQNVHGPLTSLGLSVF